MEPNQTNVTPQTSEIPQGIPTGVFVPNNQTPTAWVNQTQIPAQAQVSPMPAQEWPLDRIFKSLARFFAKIMGQPDPITGAPNVASQALQKSENIVGKVWGAANQVVAKASDVAGKAVDTATNVATQAAQQVQQIIPPPQTAAPAPTVAPTTTTDVAQPPVIEPIK